MGVYEADSMLSCIADAHLPVERRRAVLYSESGVGILSKEEEIAMKRLSVPDGGTVEIARRLIKDSIVSTL